jgi:N-acetylmuramoyl-L-alanine amidase
MNDWPSAARAGSQGSRSGLAQFGFLCALCAFVVSPALAATSGRPDRALFHEAKAALAKLQASDALKQKKSEWEKTVAKFRGVVAKYPQSPYCDDSLLEAGDLYREMGERFKSPRYRDEAAKAYRMLVAEYPSSSLGEQALYSVFELSTESKDRKRIEDAAKLYLGAFPDSKRAKDVKASVKQSAPEKAAALPSPPPPGLVPVFNLRSWSGDASTRVVVDLEKEVPIKQDRLKNPERLWVDLVGTRLHPNLTDHVFPVGDGLLEKVRIAQNRDNVVRVVLDFKDVKDQQIFYLHDPTRLVIDVRGSPQAELAKPDAKAGLEAPESAAALEKAVEDRVAAERKAASGPVPERVTVADRAIVPETSPAAVATPAPSPTPTPAASASPNPSATPARVASLTAPTLPSPAPSLAPQPPLANRTGSYSLARQLGLSARRIVIDAGHGGHDPGTIGKGGLQEKDLVLDVAQRLEKLVKEQLGADVIMTRDSDVFIPLEERTAIANSKGADLFLSIHANSSRSPKARGIETYFLNFAADPHAEEVAARENAISAATMKDLQNLVKAITLNSKIDESRDFATSVHESLIASLRDGHPDIQDRGVRTAPFYVLIGANMPSILAEIAFVSNPDEEKLLRSKERRDEIAKSLLDGVRGYLDALNRNPQQKLTRSVAASTVGAKGKKR